MPCSQRNDLSKAEFDELGKLEISTFSKVGHRHFICTNGQWRSIFNKCSFSIAIAVPKTEKWAPNAGECAPGRKKTMISSKHCATPITDPNSKRPREAFYSLPGFSFAWDIALDGYYLKYFTAASNMRMS